MFHERNKLQYDKEAYTYCQAYTCYYVHKNKGYKLRCTVGNVNVLNLINLYIGPPSHYHVATITNVQIIPLTV